MSNIYPIAVPKWGIEMVEGTINTWHFKEGDSVRKGDAVFEMESDKIVNVWDCPVDGVVRRILAQEGDAHPVGALLGVIASTEVDDAAIDAFIAAFGQTGTAKPAEASPAAPSSSPGGAEDVNSRSSPSVRALAREAHDPLFPRAVRSITISRSSVSSTACSATVCSCCAPANSTRR